MANPFFTLPVQTIFQDSGLAYSGAKVYFYDTGTSTLATIYEDEGQTTPATNPVTCNAAGRFADDDGNEITIYPQTNYDYKIKVEDPDGGEIWTQDPINFPLVPTLSTQTFVLSGGEYYAGIDQNNQTGTTYTVQNSDWSKVVTYNNASAVTVTLPDPTGSTFIDKWFSWHTNIGTGTVTINAASNINGSGSYVLYPNYSVGIVSNGSTYYTIGGNAADLIARAGSNLTIASGAITVASPFSKYLIDTESGAASDDLDTINGGAQGKLLILSIVNAARDVVVKHNTGNIFNPQGLDIKLNATSDTVTLLYDSQLTKWLVIAHSVANLDVVQVVNTQTGAVATGTTTVPLDDTIPQITEGNEYMTQAVTPKSATNILVIEAVGHFANSAGADEFVMALFQDATADALAVDAQYMAATGRMFRFYIRYQMVAGTTSATTFRIRAGSNIAGTTTFNGEGGARRYGGVINSSITITEYQG